MSDSLANKILDINITLKEIKLRSQFKKTLQIWELTWGGTLASERGAPSTRVWWNLGLSSGRHNQTNAADKKQDNGALKTDYKHYL